MRVALVSEHASPLAPLGGVDSGGQNVHVASLASALARHGAQVDVYTRRDDVSLPERVQLEPGVTVWHVDAGPAAPIPKDELWIHMDDFARDLGRRWRRSAPDVVHSHFWMSGHASLEAAAPMRIPVIHTFHALGVVKRRYQGEQDTSPAERIDVERAIARRADHIIATCTDEVFELVRMDASSSHVTVVPSGVDLGLFTPQGPREPPPQRARRLLYVGRLVERKGIGNVISALAALPDVELVVAGGPPREQLARDPEARRLGRLADASGVADRVELRGRVQREKLPPLLRSADALVSVPWYEPFGITPLEAMACGVPVVASAVGGLIDTVVDGRTGVHVPPRDPERLAAELAPLLADEPRRRSFGRAGVKRARRLYDWDRLAISTLDVYARRVRGRAVGTRTRSSIAAGGVTAGRDFSLPPTPGEQLRSLRAGLDSLEGELLRISELGRRLAHRLLGGTRLLAAGNGGSAAQAQHLTAELVGRFWSERQPLSAICLHADTSSLTAIVNDYGAEQAFARQVLAHGRHGDVLLALSTSGTSRNVIAAAQAAHAQGMHVWALTGEAPNPLLRLADEAIAFAAPATSTVQELHMVALHMLCAALDRELALDRGAAASLTATGRTATDAGCASAAAATAASASSQRSNPRSPYRVGAAPARVGASASRRKRDRFRPSPSETPQVVGS